MSPWSKTALLISGFCLIVISSARFVLGAWHPLLLPFLIVFFLGLIVSLILDYKLYLEFLSIKTARKGLGLGWSVLLVVVLLTALSYLGNRFDHSFDLTEEKINSLSEQSLSALKTLDSPLTFYIFYKGDKISEQVEGMKQELKGSLTLYKQGSSHVKIELVDTYRNNLKAEEYLSELPDKNQQEIFVFASYKNRKIRVDIPFTEESLTSAIIKAQKREFKEILFLTGHGERALNDENPAGLKILSQALADSGFITKEWNFIQQGAPQKTPALVISIGPQKPFLPLEKEWLKKYLSQGGSLLLSLDPKERHGLKDWLKQYGLIFNDDFILSQLGMLYGSPAKALGVIFDKSNPITKRMSGKQAVFFDKASSINVAPSAFEKFNFSYLVRSHQQSFTSPELKSEVPVGKLESLTMAVETRTKKEKKENTEEDKDSSSKPSFRLVLFGDSDFLSNRYIYDGGNRDLALNSFVSLAGEEELVSIRPKQPKGTKLSLNRPQRASLALLYIIVPLLFLLTGLWLWFKRRNA